MAFSGCIEKISGLYYCLYLLIPSKRDLGVWGNRQEFFFYSYAFLSRIRLGGSLVFMQSSQARFGITVT